MIAKGGIEAGTVHFRDMGPNLPMDACAIHATKENQEECPKLK